MPRARRALRRCLAACALAVASAAPASPARAAPGGRRARHEPPASAPRVTRVAHVDRRGARPGQGALSRRERAAQDRRFPARARALPEVASGRRVGAQHPQRRVLSRSARALRRGARALRDALLTEAPRGARRRPERRSVASAIATLRARIGSVVVLVERRWPGAHRREAARPAPPPAGPVRLLPGSTHAPRGQGRLAHVRAGS